MWWKCYCKVALSTVWATTKNNLVHVTTQCHQPQRSSQTRSTKRNMEGWCKESRLAFKSLQTTSGFIVWGSRWACFAMGNKNALLVFRRRLSLTSYWKKNCLLIWSALSLQTPSSAHKQTTNDPDVFHSTSGTSVTTSTKSPKCSTTESERGLAEQTTVSVTGRAPKQAHITEMRGLHPVTLTGF